MARQRIPKNVVVVSKERVSPHMLRIVFGGEELTGFGAGQFTDHYVKLQIPDPKNGDIRVRTYTVRDWNAETGLLSVDFVVHGDEGIAGPWAEAVQPGDTLQLAGPGGAYSPDPDADWHLLAGDASVIPAISCALPRIPAGVPVYTVIEVDGPEEEQPLTSPGDLRLQWIHRSAAPGEQPNLLVEAVRRLDLPDGRGSAFVHGEADSVRSVRRHLVIERGMDTENLSATGYWKARRTEEGWREYKPEWKRLAEADLAVSDVR